MNNIKKNFNRALKTTERNIWIKEVLVILFCPSLILRNACSDIVHTENTGRFHWLAVSPCKILRSRNLRYNRWGVEVLVRTSPPEHKRSFSIFFLGVSATGLAAPGDWRRLPSWSLPMPEHLGNFLYLPPNPRLSVREGRWVQYSNLFSYLLITGYFPGVSSDHFGFSLCFSNQSNPSISG